jgi:hypothetical protein
MAKSRTDDEARLTEDLLAGLRQALDGQAHLLQGAEEKQALFPAGKRGEKPAQRALTSGYVEQVEAPEGVKAAKTARYVRLTAQGRQFLQYQDDPRRVLETLLPLVRQIAERVDQMSADLQRALTSQLPSMARILEQTQDMIEGVLESERESEVERQRQVPAGAIREPEQSSFAGRQGYVAEEDEEYDAADLPPPVPEQVPPYRSDMGALQPERSTAGEPRMPERGQSGDDREEHHAHGSSGHHHHHG